MLFSNQNGQLTRTSAILFRSWAELSCQLEPELFFDRASQSRIGFKTNGEELGEGEENFLSLSLSLSRNICVFFSKCSKKLFFFPWLNDRPVEVAGVEVELLLRVGAGDQVRPLVPVLGRLQRSLRRHRLLPRCHYSLQGYFSHDPSCPYILYILYFLLVSHGPK